KFARVLPLILISLTACSREEPGPTTPTFTFRTTDHLKAIVIVNGERYSDTTCLWALSRSMEFDPRIEVSEWPPKGATWVRAATRNGEQGIPASSIEIAIEGGRY